MSIPSAPKLSEYLNWVEENFIAPATQEGVASSCTATCILLFSAADALGGLFHESDKAGNRERFNYFLDRMGKEYHNSQDRLWKLRNNLFHEGLTTGTFLSQVQKWSHRHLGGASGGHILLNTRQLTADFKRAFDRLRQEAETDTPLADRGESRLEWASVKIVQYSETTSPPPVRVDFLKKKSSSGTSR